jgi:hypothetical protein
VAAGPVFGRSAERWRCLPAVDGALAIAGHFMALAFSIDARIAATDGPYLAPPEVIVFHTEPDHGRTVLVYGGLSELEEQRVPGIDGHIHLAADEHVLLRIVLIDATDERGASKGVASIEGDSEWVEDL